MGKEGADASPPGWARRVLIGRNVQATLLRAAIWAILCVLVSQYVLLPIRVQGVSMDPTYKNNQINFINHLAYRFHPPRRGDVVAIRYSGKHVMLLKRIIGLPGETVAFHNGKAFINGQQLNEPYLQWECNWELEPEEVGPDEYYVVGDNRRMDFSDHTQGRSERKRIMGKVLL
jgi:signal peptidase I